MMAAKNLENTAFDISLRIIEGKRGDPELEEVLAQCRAICDELAKEDENLKVLRASFAPVAADFFVVAQKDREVVGAMAIQLVYDDAMSIFATIAPPNLHGRGISAEMFKYLESHAKGYDEVFSIIHKSNLKSRASRLSMGFKSYEDPDLIDSFDYDGYFKKIDPEKATKHWRDAEPATATIYTREEFAKNQPIRETDKTC